MRSLAGVLALVCGAAAAACSGPSSVPLDAGSSVDAGVDAGRGDAAPAIADPAPAVLPVLTVDGACPPGWRTIAPASADDPTLCDPWPAGGPTTCAFDEVWLPGDPGCMPIGVACPTTDDFATDLPAGTATYFVRPDATAGDGSRAAPFGTIAEAALAAGATPGAVIALSRGRHVLSEPVTLDAAVVVAGACVGETTVVGAPPRPVFNPHGGVTLHDLRFEGGSPVMLARDVAVVLRSVLVVDARGLPFSLMSGSIDAQDVVVRGGSTAFFGTDVTGSLRRLAIENTSAAAIALTGGDLSISDCLVRRAGSISGSTFALEIMIGATVRMERAVLEDGQGFGPLVADASTLELTDALLTGPARGALAGDDGFLALGASTMRITRVRLAQPRAYGILVAEAGTHAVLEDVVVSDVLGDATGMGESLSVEERGSASVRRMLVTHARAVGVLASGAGVSLDAQDVTIRDTDPSPSGEWGRALQVQLGAHVTGARLRLERNREASLVAASAGSSVVLTDVDIRDTRERACAVDRCIGAGGGVGAGAYLDAALSLVRFRVASSALAGVQLARGGMVDLREGQILANPVGINVQATGYDFARLSELVMFRDNGTNLDSRELPVPAPDTTALGP